jgi:branched-chain amino acid transport system permease protein
MSTAMTRRLVAIAFALLVLVTLPNWAPGTYYVNIGSQILFYAIFALAVDVLLGLGGLVSLGQAGLLGVTCYAVAVPLAAGWGHAAAIVIALVTALVAMAGYAVVALRATGIGFLMITLALGQILWGLAYRWISVTNGDNGITVDSRPFGQLLTSATGFYYATLVIFLFALGLVVTFVNSPFGAALRGTRDQPRRMNALGFNVWLIRFFACLFSGLLTGIAAILFVYYNQFISPQALALTASAEVVLMVISGGASTLLGPIVGAALVVIIKNVASAYIARWNFLLGAIFVLIVVFMPDGIVPGSVRLWRRWRGKRVKAGQLPKIVRESAP